MANHYKLIDYYRQNRYTAQKWVLITITETIGSSYQKSGTKALLDDNGNLIGTLSGGCLEHDVIDQAKKVLATGQAKTVFYDMRDQRDALLGYGMGCLGAVRVFFQPLHAAKSFFPLDQIASTYETGGKAVLLTVVASEDETFPVGMSFFLPIDENNFNETELPEALLSAAQNVAANKQAILKQLTVNNESLQVFIEPINPAIRLLIVGAGPDAETLAQFAKALGWWVVAVDHRPANIENFDDSNVNKLACLHPQELGKEFDLSKFNAAVIMTHNLEFDGKFLQELSPSTIPYIGLLGPCHRKNLILESLVARAQTLAGRVHGPVGLDIGAKTPEEIALSIIAGIHAKLNGRTGGQLHQAGQPEAVKATYGS